MLTAQPGQKGDCESQALRRGPGIDALVLSLPCIIFAILISCQSQVSESFTILVLLIKLWTYMFEDVVMIVDGDPSHSPAWNQVPVGGGGCQYN